MKKILMLAILFMWFGFTSANCIQFSDRSLCFNVAKQSNWNYAISSYTSPYTSNLLELSCDVLTPNNILNNVGTCNSSFYYWWNGIWTLRIYARMWLEYKIRDFSYDFTNWGNLTAINSYYTWTTIYTWYNYTWNYILPWTLYVPNWFTTNQFYEIKYVFDVRGTLVQRLQERFPSLIYNSTRQATQKQFYYDTYQVLLWSSNRVYQNYNQYYNWLKNFVIYTTQVR